MKWKGSIPKKNPNFGVYVGIFVPTFRENQKNSHLHPCFLYSHPAFHETNGLEGKYSLPSVIKSVVILRLRRKLVNRAGFFPVEYNRIEKAVLFAAPVVSCRWLYRGDKPKRAFCRLEYKKVRDY